MTYYTGHTYRKPTEPIEGCEIFESYLSMRSRNCLLNEGLRTKADVAGYVADFGFSALMRVPNMGRKSVAEVAEWIGVPVPGQCGMRKNRIALQLRQVNVWAPADRADEIVRIAEKMRAEQNANGTGNLETPLETAPDSLATGAENG
jgi:hypothetical protein